jgi:hypothetical protein
VAHGWAICCCLHEGAASYSGTSGQEGETGRCLDNVFLGLYRGASSLFAFVRLGVGISCLSWNQKASPSHSSVSLAMLASAS